MPTRELKCGDTFLQIMVFCQALHMCKGATTMAPLRLLSTHSRMKLVFMIDLEKTGYFLLEYVVLLVTNVYAHCRIIHTFL
jgi:hypothetical protein